MSRERQGGVENMGKVRWIGRGVGVEADRVGVKVGRETQGGLVNPHKKYL